MTPDLLHMMAGHYLNGADARTPTASPLFADLRGFLPGLIAAVVERQRAEPVVTPKGPFSVERQRALGVEVMKRVNFDFRHGRIDVSHHPFCGGVPRDVRITTRYDEGDFIKSFMGVLHETGHAKYEQNLPTPWLDIEIVSPWRSAGVARFIAAAEVAGEEYFNPVDPADVAARLRALAH